MIVYVPKNIKDGYYWPDATAGLKSYAIKKFIQGTYQTWPQWYRQGWRIMKCELKELDQ